MPHCVDCGRKFNSVHQLNRHAQQPFSKCANIRNTFGSHLVRVELLQKSLNPGYECEIPPDVRFGDQAPDNAPPDWQDETVNLPAFECEVQPTHSPDLAIPVFRENYLGAAETWGRGMTFMDVFDADYHSDERKSNLYYPFASREEWQLGYFLLSSGMSMPKIDLFLRLNLVSKSFLYQYCSVTHYMVMDFHRSNSFPSRLKLPRNCEGVLKCCQLVQNGEQNHGRQLILRNHLSHFTIKTPWHVSNFCLTPHLS